MKLNFHWSDGMLHSQLTYITGDWFDPSKRRKTREHQQTSESQRENPHFIYSARFCLPACCRYPHHQAAGGCALFRSSAGDVQVWLPSPKGLRHNRMPLVHGHMTGHFKTLTNCPWVANRCNIYVRAIATSAGGRRVWHSISWRCNW